MRFSQGIVRHGTEGVRAYREISGIGQDNRLPEIFIGSWIARGLHEDFRVKARVECHFTEMAKDLGQEVGLDLVNVMGGWRADVAVYEGEKPTAVIELKIHDEGGRNGLVLRDLHKMQELCKRTGMESYLGVLITDTSSEVCKTRADALARMLQQPYDELGLPIRAGGGNADWSWQFACWGFERRSV